jgi:hypothetical protein
MAVCDPYGLEQEPVSMLTSDDDIHDGAVQWCTV